MRRTFAVLGGTAAALSPLSAVDAFACSVCFVDPTSSIAQGAVWGVAVLLGVVVTVLGSIIGMIVFWARRAQRVSASLKGQMPAPSAGAH